MTSPSTAGWRADLKLGFQQRLSGTILGQCAHQGPLRVQRPFYPEGPDVCHVAILHPPGGVVGGDELRLDVRIETGARALLTTPAAAKFYRSAGALAVQTQQLTVAAGGALEWLPQENIVYCGARIHAQTRVELHSDAHFIGWEILCLGRPAAAEVFQTGECRQTLELWRDGEPLYLEQANYRGGDSVLKAAWGLQDQPVIATLLCTPPGPGLTDVIRAGWKSLAIPAPVGELIAVTQLDSVLIGRYLGPSTLRARRFFTLAWELLRPQLLQRPPCTPRFWNT